MQIKNIKISNILNYDFVANLNEVSGISFNTKEMWVMNIIIWPNWSWKSNLLEIINQIYKVWLEKDFYYNKTELEIEEKHKSVIIEFPSRTHNLEKHKDHLDKKSEVQMTILLHKGDFDNINFLVKNAEIINNIIKKYSNLDITFSSIAKEILTLENKLLLHFSFDEKSRKIFLNDQNLNETQKYILHYIQHKELIEICMHLYNKYEKPKETRWRYALKNTFAILWPNRSYWRIRNKTYLPTLSELELNRIIAEQDTKHRSARPLWYYLCKKKIKEYSIYRSDYTTQFIKNINDILQPHFWYQLIVHSWDEHNIIFKFLSNHWHLYHIDELSSWIQSIIFIILTLFGHDLHHGLCVIDEPELHLHPQLQQKLVEALDEIQKRVNIQIIVATHSPLFIDEKNIYNVIRLSTDSEWISIKMPSKYISQHEANMIHMLKYEHMTKIFFVNKIIMVEGETDAYFLNFFIEYLRHHNIIEHIEYDILSIWWKWDFKKRKNFLTKFGINTYYVWDWDNALDTIPVPQIHQYKNLMHSRKPEDAAYHLEFKTQFYEKLILILKEKNNATYQKINKLISKLFWEWIFYFKQWDLETYTWIRKKWLEETIQFCSTKFNTRFKSEKYKPYRDEITEIIKAIFT